MPSENVVQTAAHGHPGVGAAAWVLRDLVPAPVAIGVAREGRPDALGVVSEKLQFGPQPCSMTTDDGRQPERGSGTTRRAAPPGWAAAAPVRPGPG